MMENNLSTMLPYFITIKEAGELFRLSKSTVLRNMKNGTLSCVKIGRRTLIPAMAIDGFIKKSVSENT
jgi:excisionase family DNA binding protein